jgi:predicted aspartyl protease
MEGTLKTMAVTKMVDTGATKTMMTVEVGCTRAVAVAGVV